MDFRLRISISHPLFRLLALAFCLGFSLPAPGQRIYDTDFLARRMGLETAIPADVRRDFEQLPVVLDSLEARYDLDSADYGWLCLQVFRICAMIGIREHEGAAIASHQCLGTPPAQRNNFATRAMLTLEFNARYWIANPGLGALGTQAAMRAIDLSQEAGDKQLEFDLSVFLASIYLDCKRSDLAWEWLDRAKVLLPDIDDALNCHLYYSQAADASRPNKRNAAGMLVWNTPAEEATAMGYVEKAISCGEQAFAEGHAFESDVGLAYKIRADYWRSPEEELLYYKKVIPYYHLRGPIALAQGHASLAGIYLKEGKLDSAMTYMDSSRTLVTKYGYYPPFKARCYKNYVRYYELLGDQPESLLAYQMLYFKAQSEGSEAKALAGMEHHKFQYQKAKQKLTILEQQSEIESRTLRNRSLSLTLVAVGLIAVLILFSLLRIRQRNKVIREKSGEIGRMIETLQDNLEEKSVLVQEVNHRIKNNLQLIIDFVDIQTQFVKEGETDQFAKGIRRRIRAIGLLHELIIEETRLRGMEFADYFKELIAELEYLYYRGHAFQCHEDLAAEKLDISTGMYLGILLNELVSNSMKHAVQEGETLAVWISLKREGEELVLRYRDSGPGVPEGAFSDKQKGPSIGLMLVDAMSRQLDGEMEYVRGEKNEYRLRFPYAKQEKSLD